ncbi:MAG: sulfatase-like hydrolase/transferase [Kiritimatiellae bacterium]|nr:sulfatase-like hydrolase/transferase [Kiritimatiellia bacterium]
MVKVSRRTVLKAGVLGGAYLATWPAARSLGVGTRNETRPNFLFINTDQQAFETISALGGRKIHTPNLDHLVRTGVSFTESYCTNPLCSPSRSSWFTGRMPSETGVLDNGRPIADEVPNLGQWLGREGYETAYVGKWHLPRSYQFEIPGFKVLPAGINSNGSAGDTSVARAAQAFLLNRKETSTPFLLNVSFLNPHDVCEWLVMHRKAYYAALAKEAGLHGREAPDAVRFPGIEEELPELPANFGFDDREPGYVKGLRTRPSGRLWYNERQWRYYLWNYYRMVELVDAEVGRVLQALADSVHAKNTMVVFASDHGEGCAHHQMVKKRFLYDEAARVPLIVSCPDRTASNVVDTRNLVSGLDIMPTLCDFAGVQVPEKTKGVSLRPLLEGRTHSPREFVVAEVDNNKGRMLRTQGHKYIAHGTHERDPFEQLFDMKNDRGETRNLAGDAGHASVLAQHRKLLNTWESGLEYRGKEEYRFAGS